VEKEKKISDLAKTLEKDIMKKNKRKSKPSAAKEARAAAEKQIEDEEKAAEEAAAAPVVDGPEPEAEAEAEPVIDVVVPQPVREEQESTASWGGIWGVSLKKTKKADAKKEADTLANHDAPKVLAKADKADEATLPSAPPATTTNASTFSKSSIHNPNANADIAATATTGTIKGLKSSTGKGSVAERIKALEKEKKAKRDAASVPPPPPPPPPGPEQGAGIEVLDPDFDLEFLSELEAEPVVIVETPAPTKKSTKELKKDAKSSKTSKKTKTAVDSTPGADFVPEGSAALLSPLPGGFPDDDLLDFVGDEPLPPPPPTAPTAMGKTVAKKTDKKTTKKGGKADAKKAEPESVIVVPLPPPEIAAEGTKDSGSTTAVEDPTKPPTPPPEPEAPSPKKERAKVVRQNGASSWGFWGAAPKQTSSAAKKAKDDLSATPAAKPKAAPPAPTRSKSARKATDKDPDKSSVSDKAKSAASRPKSSRNQSGFSIFGATPSRSRSVRQSATPKTASRAASESRDAAMLTPPPDEDLPKVSEKAAKVMGMSTRERASMSRKASARSRKTKATPDPYSVDDNDVVMVDPVVAADVASPSAEKAARRKSQRTSRAPAEDTLVDIDGLDATTGAEDAAFETPRRPSVRRSNTTSTKKAGGFMGGLFGMSAGRDDRRSRGYETEDGAARSKRSRSDRERPTTGRVYDTDAPPADADAEAEARRAERKRRRAERERQAEQTAAAERAEADAKAARKAERQKRRDAEDRAKEKEDRERRLRAEEDAEARRLEEKKQRRVAREERRAREDQQRKEEEAREAERRARKREREREREKAAAAEKLERRHSTMEKASRTSDEERRLRREERRVRRQSGMPSNEKRRSTTAADPINDYFDPRNASRGNGATTAPARPYLGHGPDKTSSWVNSFNAEPPEPPPVEGSVVEPPPGGEDHDSTADEEARKDLRHPDRTTQRKGGHPDGVDGTREKEKKVRRKDARPSLANEMRSSDGSGGDGRRRSVYGGGMANGYADEGRPAPMRRASTFKKMFGF